MASSIAKAYVQVIPSAEGIQGALTDLFSGKEAESAGKATGAAVGGSMMKALGGLGVASVLKDSFVAVFDTGKEFDSAMSQVAATMGKSVYEISDLRDTAKEMGATTAFTATEAAEGLNYLALAGYTTEQQMAALPTVLNLAAAGAMDLGSASDMVTDAMSALGIEVTQDNLEHFADQLAKTASSSNTSVSQLGEALLTVGGTAKNLSGGTEEAALALGLLANNGIKASEGGTHLRNILLAMNPTTKKAKEAWKALGISAYDTDGKLRPMQEVFADLNEAMVDFTDQEKTDMLTAMFNKTDLASVNALLSTSTEEWNKLGDAIEDCGGAADTMAKTQLDNVEGSLTLMGSALDGLKLSLWDTFKDVAKGAIDKFTGVISGVQSFIDEHSESIKEFINGIGDTFDTVFTTIQGIFEDVTEQLGLDESSFSEVFEKGGNAIEEMKGVFDSVSEGVKNTISWLREQIQTEGTPINKIIKSFGEAFETAKGVINGVIEEIIGFIKSFTEKTGDEGSTVDRIFTEMQTVIEAVATAISTAIDAVKKVFNKLGFTSDKLMANIHIAFSLIKFTIDNNIDLVTGIFQALISFIKGDFEGAFTALKDALGRIFKRIKEFATQHFGGVISVFERVITKARELWTKISGYFTSLKNSIQNTIDTILGKIEALKRALSFEGFSKDISRFNETYRPPVSGFDATDPSTWYYADGYDNPHLLTSTQPFGYDGHNVFVGGDRGRKNGGELVYSHDMLMSDISAASGADRIAELIVLFGEFMDRFSSMAMVTDTGAVIGEIGPGMQSYSKRAGKVGRW